MNHWIILLKTNVPTKYSHSQNIQLQKLWNSRLFMDILWISEWISNPAVSTIFPHIHCLHFLSSPFQSIPAKIWQKFEVAKLNFEFRKLDFYMNKSSSPNSKLSLATSNFCRILAGIDWNGEERKWRQWICGKIVETAGFDIHSEIHSISINNREFQSFWSWIFCEWLYLVGTFVFNNMIQWFMNQLCFKWDYWFFKFHMIFEYFE